MGRGPFEGTWCGRDHGKRGLIATFLFYEKGRDISQREALYFVGRGGLFLCIRAGYFFLLGRAILSY